MKIQKWSSNDLFNRNQLKGYRKWIPRCHPSKSNPRKWSHLHIHLISFTSHLINNLHWNHFTMSSKEFNSMQTNRPMNTFATVFANEPLPLNAENRQEKRGHSRTMRHAWSNKASGLFRFLGHWSSSFFCAAMTQFLITPWMKAGMDLVILLVIVLRLLKLLLIASWQTLLGVNWYGSLSTLAWEKAVVVVIKGPLCLWYGKWDWGRFQGS